MSFDTLKVIEKLNLPFPWETNTRGQIIMTPHGYDHSFRAARFAGSQAPAWEPLPTSSGLL